MADPQRYPIPGATHRVEEEILRSRFITTLAYAPTLDDARSFIAAVAQEFADASHSCWAYVVGPPGSTAQIGMSDAGEPHGTAGRPMLNVLLHADIGEVGAVVTRYFGGTLLGKGGLVRAYSGGVTLALASLPIAERIPQSTLLLVIDYAAVTPLHRLLGAFEATLAAEEFAADVTCRVVLPTANVAAFSAAIVDMTSGQALIEELAPDDSLS